MSDIKISNLDTLTSGNFNKEDVIYVPVIKLNSLNNLYYNYRIELDDLETAFKNEIKNDLEISLKTSFSEDFNALIKEQSFENYIKSIISTYTVDIDAADNTLTVGNNFKDLINKVNELGDLDTILDIKLSEYLKVSLADSTFVRQDTVTSIISSSLGSSISSTVQNYLTGESGYVTLQEICSRIVTDLYIKTSIETYLDSKDSKLENKITEFLQKETSKELLSGLISLNSIGGFNLDNNYLYCKNSKEFSAIGKNEIFLFQLSVDEVEGDLIYGTNISEIINSLSLNTPKKNLVSEKYLTLNPQSINLFSLGTKAVLTASGLTIYNIKHIDSIISLEEVANISKDITVLNLKLKGGNGQTGSLSFSNGELLISTVEGQNDSFYRVVNLEDYLPNGDLDSGKSLPSLNCFFKYNNTFYNYSVVNVGGVKEYVFLILNKFYIFNENLSYNRTVENGDSLDDYLKPLSYNSNSVIDLSLYLDKQEINFSGFDRIFVFKSVPVEMKYFKNTTENLYVAFKCPYLQLEGRNYEYKISYFVADVPRIGDPTQNLGKIRRWDLNAPLSITQLFADINTITYDHS